MQRKPILFLFVDTQIINEKMVEDVNNVLNSGDVPNLYNPAQMEDIQSSSRKDCARKGIDPTPLNLFREYLINVKK